MSAPLHRSACAHEDVRYSAKDQGAIACYRCGRLFGHLSGETFTAFNPEPLHSLSWEACGRGICALNNGHSGPCDY